MQEFKNDYGTRFVDGQKALATSFQALTASSIYIGDLLGALVAAPINDRWGRKTTFWLPPSAFSAVEYAKLRTLTTRASSSRAVS
jgi:MFS family permease